MPSREAERDYYLDKLEEKGFVSVPFGITAADINPLFDEFRDFLDICEQPGGERFREAIAFKPADRFTGGDYFVARRRVGEINHNAVNLLPSTEDKDIAHIGPRSFQMAHERLGGHMPVVMRQFLDSCLELHEAAKTSVRPVFRSLGLERVLLAEDSLRDEHVVRLLRYLGSSASHKAGLHFDRSVATLAAWESHPGLVGGPGQNAQRRGLDITELETAAAIANQTPIRHHSGSAKVFLGAGYNRLPDQDYSHNGELPLLLHGVLNERPNEERYAVVVFMHPPARYPGYQVPSGHETGLEGVRDHILRRSPPHEAVA